MSNTQEKLVCKSRIVFGLGRKFNNNLTKMNKLTLTSALLSLFVLLSVATFSLANDQSAEPANEIPEGFDPDDELDGGYRDEVGAKANDLWGTDINENGIGRAVEKQKPTCPGLYYSNSSCEKCCQKNNFDRHRISMGRCTCIRTDNRFHV